MKRYLDLSNEAPVYTMWQMLEPQIESVRRGLARDFGCDPEEMAITRNASESLEAIQLGLDLKPGDEILTTTHDYPRMLTTWRQRERRDGVVLKTFPFPVPPPSLDDLYERFERAVTPRTKVILVCHITNLTGQIFPVKRICQHGARARHRGDRGRRPRLRPLPLHARRPRLRLLRHQPPQVAVRPARHGLPLRAALEDREGLAADAGREAAGRGHPQVRGDRHAPRGQSQRDRGGARRSTRASAIERKAARLRYLRDRFLRRLAQSPRVRVHTSFDPSMSCGIGNLQVEGIDSAALAKHLFDARRIIVVPIKHAEFEGLRVTPCVYTTTDEVDRFAEAVEQVIAKGLPA